MEKREPTVIEMLDMYKDDWSLFYLPYADATVAEETYQWRKRILKKLEEELDKQYAKCYNKA